MDFTDRIQVIIDAAAGGFVRGTSEAADSSTRFGQATGWADEKLQGMGVTGVRTGDLLKAGLAAGATVAGAAIVKFGKDSVDAFVDGAGAVRDFSRASGATAEESSRFVAVLDDMNLSADTGATAIFRLGRNVEDGGEKLKEYGVEVAKNKDGTTDLTGTLLNVADAYTRIDDPATRAQLVQDAFGRGGRDLIPILEQGRQGLESFFAEAEKNHQIFSQEDIDRAREYELALDSLDDAVEGLQRSAGEALIPTLTSVANTTASTITTADELTASVGGLAGTLGFANEAFNPLMFGIHGASGAMKILHGDFRDGAQEMTGMLGPVGMGIEKVGQLTGIFHSGGQEVDAYTAASKRLQEAQQAVVRASNEEGRKSGELAEAKRELARATDEYTQVQGRVIKNLETEEDRQSRLIAKEAERRGSILGLTESSLSLEAKQIDLSQAMDDYRQKTEAGTLSELERREEEIKLEEQVLSVAEASRQHAEATSTATDAAGKAKDGTAAYDQTLQFLAGTLAPGDPLRRRLDELIWNLGVAGADRTARLGLDASQADAEIDRINGRLWDLANRQVTVTVGVAGGAIRSIGDIVSDQDVKANIVPIVWGV